MVTIGTYTLTEVQTLVALVLLSSLVLQLFYYLFFYSRIFSIKPTRKANTLPPVSVVICARNEAENLARFLPQVLAQKYPEFQVVVVDDCSDDESGYLLAQLKVKHPNLHFTQIFADNVFPHAKKLALNIGIKAAKYEHILLIDADCYPTSDQWMQEMASNFLTKTEFVLGYGAYEKKPGLLNFLIRFDTAFIGWQYLSFARAGMPYMGVGRNLAYLKQVFKDNRGFGKFNQMQSGDDDLLVNQRANSGNTAICLSPNSITISEPKTSWFEWRRQKRRHATTAPHYKFYHKLLLGLEPLSRILFYFSLFAAFYFFPTFVYYTFGVYLLRATLQVVIASKAFSLLGDKNLVWSILFLDVLMPFVYIWLIMPQKKKTRKLNSWM